MRNELKSLITTVEDDAVLSLLMDYLEEVKDGLTIDIPCYILNEDVHSAKIATGKLMQINGIYDFLNAIAEEQRNKRGDNESRPNYFTTN